MGPDRRQLLTFQDINYLDLCLWYEEWQCTFEMFSNELKSQREGRWTVNFEHRNNEPGGLGSQGANQVFQRFNSFVPGLIGCLTRLGGFLWPQLETSVKRLDEHSESVKCFNNQLAVSLFKTRSPAWLFVFTKFSQRVVFQTACLHACFCGRGRLQLRRPSSSSWYQFSCFYSRSDSTRFPSSPSAASPGRAGPRQSLSNQDLH